MRTTAQGEYYLTDVIGIAAALGRRVCGYQAVDSRVAMGANDRKGLLRLNEIARQAELERHMDSGSRDCLCRRRCGLLRAL